MPRSAQILEREMKRYKMWKAWATVKTGDTHSKGGCEQRFHLTSYKSERPGGTIRTPRIIHYSEESDPRRDL